MFAEASIVTETAFAKVWHNDSIANVDDKDYMLVLDKEEESDYYFNKILVKVKGSYARYS